MSRGAYVLNLQTDDDNRIYGKKGPAQDTIPPCLRLAE
jgi:hypothetical protein